MLLKIFVYVVVIPAIFAFILGLLANVFKTIENGSTLKETPTADSTNSGNA
ncbi:MAG: hypothetical protein VKK42_30480 [Lyngbya sp.]|nr:hypothetical protein [Lyngbya sp.]